MGDNSIISVFSNIWSSVRLKIPPHFQASWQHRLLTFDMGSLKKFTPFPFIFPKRCPLSFKYFIAANKCVISICLCPRNIIEISISREKMSSKYVVKNTRSVAHFVSQTFFHWISRFCQIKNIKYIHKNLRYYETIVQLLYWLNK